MRKKNWIQKINKENDQLILEVEFKLDLLVAEQTNNSNKLKYETGHSESYAWAQKHFNLAPGE